MQKQLLLRLGVVTPGQVILFEAELKKVLRATSEGLRMG